MSVGESVQQLLRPSHVRALRSFRRRYQCWLYERGGSRPWSTGYSYYRQSVIEQALLDEVLLECFRTMGPLPAGYGVGVDERCIELPWIISHLRNDSGILLDAGSSLNHEFLLDDPALRNRPVNILTLAPEPTCFWRRGISYLYHDMRAMPFRDCYFDVITCISTLEHVGCDNSIGTANPQYQENRPEDVSLAMRELCRVLKPGGRLFLTVPFGRYALHRGFQLFDLAHLLNVIKSFDSAPEVRAAYYRYLPDGWTHATAEDCAGCEYVEWVAQAWDTNRWPDPIPMEPDRAAAARAVACVVLTKR